MSRIYLRTCTIDIIFEQLKQHLGGVLYSYQDEYQLTLDNEIACGKIHGIYVNRDFAFMEYDVTFLKDVVIVSKTPDTNPLYFMYCAKGKLNHSFGSGENKIPLYQFQTSIFSSHPGTDSALFFQKGKSVKATVITMATAGETSTGEYLGFFGKKEMDTFKPKGDAKSFYYIGSDNLQITDQLRKLEAIKQHGVVRNLLIKGIVHTILALKLQQHNEDIQNQLVKSCSLTRHELDEIKELSDFIRNYPDMKFTITFFEKKSSLSAAKLQEGFKFLLGRTISDYVKSIRLEHAEKLIKTTSLSISEIVYAVGFTSRSYFSRIFKTKYNCCPKYYQDNQLWAKTGT